MYKATKPCRFGGRQFYVGETIPAELIDESRVTALVKYGTIVSVPETAQEASQTETGTITSPDTQDGSQGVKQAFNTKPETAQKPESKRAQAKQPVKKGGK